MRIGAAGCRTIHGCPIVWKTHPGQPGRRHDTRSGRRTGSAIARLAYKYIRNSKAKVTAVGIVRTILLRKHGRKYKGRTRYQDKQSFHDISSNKGFMMWSEDQQVDTCLAG